MLSRNDLNLLLLTIIVKKNKQGKQGAINKVPGKKIFFQVVDKIKWIPQMNS